MLLIDSRMGCEKLFLDLSLVCSQLQVLLVLGAAGGVGFAAVQIGKKCGATVIAIARY